MIGAGPRPTCADGLLFPPNACACVLLRSKPALLLVQQIFDFLTCLAYLLNVCHLFANVVLEKVLWKLLGYRRRVRSVGA